MKRFSDNPTIIWEIGGKTLPEMSRAVHSRQEASAAVFLYLKTSQRYGTIVVVVGRRQAVKAKDFDSLIEGSNPAGPAK